MTLENTTLQIPGEKQNEGSPGFAMKRSHTADEIYFGSTSISLSSESSPDSNATFTFPGVPMLETEKKKKKRGIRVFKKQQCCEHEETADDHDYDILLEGNKKYVAAKLQEDPEYFQKRSQSQQPKYILIGCADSRVPPDQLTQTEPGEMFIHRNVANLVVNSDMNIMAVLQYGIEVLKVKHVIVMGHYNCGGVKAAMSSSYNGLIDMWLLNIKDVQRLHQHTLDEIKDEEEKFKALVEINTREQALNVCKTNIVQKAWARGQELHVHAWVYDIFTGYIKDLNIEEEQWKKVEPSYKLEFDH